MFKGGYSGKERVVNTSREHAAVRNSLLSRYTKEKENRIKTYQHR
jgi:hypothetical protein